jgi:hypothetical protein
MYEIFAYLWNNMSLQILKLNIWQEFPLLSQFDQRLNF